VRPAHFAASKGCLNPAYFYNISAALFHGESTHAGRI
jgi:hypothetical protein